MYTMRRTCNPDARYDRPKPTNADDSSTEHALVVRRGSRRCVRRRELGIPSNPETLCRRNPLIVQAVLHTAVQNTDAHHGKQLQRHTNEHSIAGKKKYALKLTLWAALEWS